MTEKQRIRGTNPPAQSLPPSPPPPSGNQKAAKHDRPIVTGSNGKTRQVKHGDEGREQCAKCSTDDHPVFMAAVSSRQYFSYYRCTVCGTTAKIPHYTRLAKLQRYGPRKEFAER